MVTWELWVILDTYNKSENVSYCWLQRDSNSDHSSRLQARWPIDHHHLGPKIFEFFVIVLSNQLTHW